MLKDSIWWTADRRLDFIYSFFPIIQVIMNFSYNKHLLYFKQYFTSFTTAPCYYLRPPNHHLLSELTNGLTFQLSPTSTLWPLPSFWASLNIKEWTEYLKMSSDYIFSVLSTPHIPIKTSAIQIYRLILTSRLSRYSSSRPPQWLLCRPLTIYVGKFARFIQTSLYIHFHRPSWCCMFHGTYLDLFV